MKTKTWKLLGLLGSTLLFTLVFSLTTGIVAVYMDIQWLPYIGGPIGFIFGYCWLFPRVEKILEGDQ